MTKTQKARELKVAEGCRGSWMTEKGRWKVAESRLEVKRTTEACRGRERVERARARAKSREPEPEPELEPQARAKSQS